MSLTLDRAQRKSASGRRTGQNMPILPVDFATLPVQPMVTSIRHARHRDARGPRMSNRALQWAFRLPVTGAAKAVLLALADCLNDRTGRCNPSHATLALHAGVDERTVRRACASLQESHLVETIERPGRPSQYKLAVGTKSDTPDTTPDHKADEPWTPRPTLGDETPGTMPDPGHHARPTPGMVSETPGTTPDEPLEPKEQPERTKRVAPNQRAEGSLFSNDAAPVTPTAPRTRAPRAKSKTAIDPAWKPDAKGLAYAASRGIIDVPAEVEKFVDWHLSHGMTRADYNAAWRNWCRKAQEFRQGDGPHTTALRNTAGPAAVLDLRYFGRPPSEVAALPQPRVGSQEHHAWVAANDGLETPAPDTVKSKIRTAL
jgi:hypothetical protein